MLAFEATADVDKPIVDGEAQAVVDRCVRVDAFAFAAAITAGVTGDPTTMRKVCNGSR